MNPRDPAVDALILAHLEGCLTPQEEQALHRRLLEDDEALSQFVECMDLHAMLVGDAALAGVMLAAQDAKAPAAPHRAAIAPRRGWQRVGLAAAAVVLLGLGLAFWGRPEVEMLRVAGGRFASAAAQPQTREWVGRSEELTAGLVELRFRKAEASVVIEAPARFQVVDARTLRLESGRATAHVRNGRHGLRILTPHTDVLDLGTRFAVDVESGRRSEVHVFEGKVEAGAPSSAGTVTPLVANEALRFESGLTPEAREIRSGAFVQPEEIRPLAAGLVAGQQARAMAALKALRQDPALIALLDFESGEPPPGVFRMTQGRWPGSRAPEFVNVGDHMKLDAGGGRAWPRLTVAAWVRLDRLGAPYQSLYHTNGWEIENPGQVHWMINKDTTMRLALKLNVFGTPGSSLPGFVDSRTPVLPERGRWVHLAVVYDAEAKHSRFYLNGALDSEAGLTTAHPALLGPAQIGNWNAQDRRLSGRVDELILLGRAMSTAEVRALFDAGNPYR